MDVICDVISDAESQQAERRPLHEAAAAGGCVEAAPTPVSAVRLSNRCVLLTYFDCDVDASIDQHFTRSLTAAAPATHSYESKYAANSLHGAHVYDHTLS